MTFPDRPLKLYDLPVTLRYQEEVIETGMTLLNEIYLGMGLLKEVSHKNRIAR
jgi:hypothetical protein